jgi:uncharacterized protein YeaO (DUF488 family)
MAVRVVRLGSPRTAGEGLRIGTVRRPPRGVPKPQLASRDFYDVWFPSLAPSEPLLKRARAAETDREWRAFARAYRAEAEARREPRARPARGALPPGELLGRLLLRRRDALPPVDLARAARGTRRGARRVIPAPRGPNLQSAGKKSPQPTGSDWELRTGAALPSGADLALPRPQEEPAMRPRSIAAAAGCTLLLATGCATSGDMEKLEQRVDGLEQRFADVERRAASAESTAQRAAADARAAAQNADTAGQRADAMFKKTVEK